jgi:two-component system sensor histidine kinase YesM
MSERFFIDKFSITNAKVMNQIIDRFESFHYSVVIASNNLLQSGTIKNILTEEQSNREKMSAYFNIKQQMKRVKSNVDAYEIGIIVTGINGISYSTNRTYWPITDQELRDNDITRHTLKEPKRLMYQYDFRQDLGETIEDEQFIVASKALMERISGNVYGAMYFAIQEKEFRKFYNSYTSPGNNVFVLDKSGVIVSSNQTKLIGQKAEELLSYAKERKEDSNNYLTGKFMGQEQIIFVEYLPSFDMYLFNLIDKKTAIGDLIDKKAIFMISMGIVIIALIIVFFISRRLRMLPNMILINMYLYQEHMKQGKSEKPSTQCLMNSMIMWRSSCYPKNKNAMPNLLHYNNK